MRLRRQPIPSQSLFDAEKVDLVTQGPSGGASSAVSRLRGDTDEGTAIGHSLSVYEVRGDGVWRFLLAPFAGMLTVITITSVVLVAAGGWFWLAAPVWLAWIEWRTSKLRLRSDASGITVVNLVRRYRIPWAQVRAVLAVAGDFHDFPATVSLQRTRGKLWGVDVHATLGFSKSRRREVALQIARVGRAYGYGFPTGDAGDLEALHRAGLVEDPDAAAHEQWWNTRESDQSVVNPPLGSAE